MSFGLGPFGVGTPVGSIDFGPAAAVPQAISVVSSRKINFADGTYELDADGNFLGMPDLHQAAVLLVAFNVTEPKVIGRDFEISVANQIRAALRPLTSTRPPRLVIDSIEVVANASENYRIVRFRDGTLLRV